MTEWKLTAESNKKKANTKPTAKPAEITTYWDREDPVYHSLVVKVLKRVGTKIQFAVWSPETDELLLKKGKPYSINLADYLNVLDELPSTAKLASKKKPFGLLFVTDSWAKANGVSLRDGGNGKVPRPASL